MFFLRSLIETAVEEDAAAIFCRFWGGDDELPAPSPSLARFLFLAMVFGSGFKNQNHRDPKFSSIPLCVTINVCWVTPYRL